MKYLILITMFLFINIDGFAAESTVKPFEFSFTMKAGEHDVDGEIIQNCRYEKFVISDSAEYVNDYKHYPLEIKRVKSGDREVFTISNPKERYHEISGWLKPTKACNAQIKLFIKSNKYSAWLRTRAISFLYWPKAHYKDYVLFDASEIETKIANKHLEFEYVKIGSNQVNIHLLIDGVKDFWPSQTAAQNAETGMPYPLKK